MSPLSADAMYAINGVHASNVYGYYPLTLLTWKTIHPNIQERICLTV